MAKLPAPYICDFDGTQKLETNAWWLIQADPLNFCVRAWEDGNPDLEGVQHACSEQCLGRALNQWAEARRSKPSSGQVLSTIPEGVLEDIPF